MIIKIQESKVFTVNPAKRFADVYKISGDIYDELWRRYRMLEYSIPELCELFYIKVGRPINKMSMDRWMFRGRIYTRAQEAIKKGALGVDSSFFGDLEERLVNELFDHVRDGFTSSIRVLA